MLCLTTETESGQQTSPYRCLKSYLHNTTTKILELQKGRRFFVGNPVDFVSGVGAGQSGLCVSEWMSVWKDGISLSTLVPDLGDNEHVWGIRRTFVWLKR